MKIDLATLPNDLALSHQIINDLVVKLSSTEAKLDIVEVKLDNAEVELRLLQAQLVLLKAKRFGKSSEKLDQQIAQLEFFIEEAESAGKVSANDMPVDLDEASHPKKEKQQPKRQKLPNYNKLS